MKLYCDGGDKWYPVYSVCARREHEYESELEFTAMEAAFVLKAFEDFEEAQKMIMAKMEEAARARR